MTETDTESRLRRFLASYERLCKKYGLMVCVPKVYETYTSHTEFLPLHIDQLKEGGINA